MFEWTSLFALLITTGGALFIALLSTIHSHSLFLYGHRIRSLEGATSFRLAIQNAEAAPLEGRLRLELTCGPGARFLERPRIFAGPRGMRGGLSSDQRRYLLEFDCLPAHDTWIIECRVTSEPDDIEFGAEDEAWTDVHAVTLRLGELDSEGKVRSRILRRMSVDVLSMSSTDSIKAIGRTRKPLVRLGALTMLLAAVIYAVTICFWFWVVQGDLSFVWYDAVMLLVLWAITAGFIRLAAPPAVRAVQGYLEATQVAPLVGSNGVTHVNG